MVFSACDSGGSGTSGPAYNELNGTITGQVIDRATSEPIEGARVVVAIGSLGTDTNSFSATTGGEGTFAITDVPVTTATGEGPDTSDVPSASYGVRVKTPGDSPYRDMYRGQATVAFGDTEGGPTGNLTANLTFPLSKTTGTVSGQIQLEDTGEPLREGPLVLYQQLPVQFDANGNPQTFINLRRVDTTGSDGSFAFDGVEVGRPFDLYHAIGGEEFIDDGVVPAGESSVSVSETVSAPDFEIVDITPQGGTDVDTTRPSITISFNRSVADNEFARADAPLSGVNGNGEGAHLIDELYVFPGQAKSMKDLSPDNRIPVDISFGSGRAELVVTPAQGLQDGYNYTHIAEGLDDVRFTGKYGLPLANADRAYIDFSVGANDSKPAVPSVSFNSASAAVNDDSLADGTLDYTNASVTVPLQVDNIDDSQAEVKGYEVYYRSQNQAGRSGVGDQFIKATDVSPEATGFEDSDGIIPADAVESGEFDDGNLEFTVTVDGFPFASEDGAYGEIEWKVRAVSINNVRGDFTDVIPTDDNTGPAVVAAFADDQDGDGDDEIITVEFSEPLTTSSVAVGDFTVQDNADNTRDILNAVEDVENDQAGRGASSTVTISLDDGTSIDDTFDGDEVVVDGSVTDLAGNEQDTDDNSAAF
jgi:hypothetical protein